MVLPPAQDTPTPKAHHSAGLTHVTSPGGPAVVSADRLEGCGRVWGRVDDGREA